MLMCNETPRRKMQAEERENRFSMEPVFPGTIRVTISTKVVPLVISSLPVLIEFLVDTWLFVQEYWLV